jgi:GT2 family glycosyltransferase
MELKTAIVILNWNGKHFLERFLHVLLERTPQPWAQVFIADNGSTDGSVSWLKETYPNVSLILFDKNYGYTGGYNKALQQIEADYYVLLNSDVEVTPGWLPPLVEYLEQNKEYGICMPKVLSWASQDTFEYAGACGGYIDRLGFPFCRGRILTHIEKDEGQYDYPAPVFWASGVCMVVQADLYHRLGGLDDHFFAHMEEIDFCWRAHWAGYRAAVVPASTIFHVGGGTLHNDSPHKLYLNYRNNLLMLYKNLSKRGLVFILPARWFLDYLSAVAYFFQGKWSFMGSVFKAHIHFWKKLRYMERHKGIPTPNLRGVVYRRSIILRFFLSFKNITFSKLRMG